MDHLIPLGIGGADDESNLWPQPYDEAILKDKLEWHMRDLVCKENVRSPAQIEKLQQEIRTNWWDAYKKYVTQ
jgi:phage pi2 protein 07